MTTVYLSGFSRLISATVMIVTFGGRIYILRRQVLIRYFIGTYKAMTTFSTRVGQAGAVGRVN